MLISPIDIICRFVLFSDPKVPIIMIRCLSLPLVTFRGVLLHWLSFVTVSEKMFIIFQLAFKEVQHRLLVMVYDVLHPILLTFFSAQNSQKIYFLMNWSCPIWSSFETMLIDYSDPNQRGWRKVSSIGHHFRQVQNALQQCPIRGRQRQHQRPARIQRTEQFQRLPEKRESLRFIRSDRAGATIGFCAGGDGRPYWLSGNS